MEPSAAAKYADYVHEETLAKETLLGTLKGRDTPGSSHAYWVLREELGELYRQIEE
jgi:hypothetical protein